ncbi:MAG: BCSC C-terminal domain-containing protein [Zetaproteobacteria bacterium]|nr:BCSC C-terminal domain-containing protein [Zetaproteobacteria bacterium]
MNISKIKTIPLLMVAIFSFVIQPSMLIAATFTISDREPIEFANADLTVTHKKRDSVNKVVRKKQREMDVMRKNELESSMKIEGAAKGPAVVESSGQVVNDETTVTQVEDNSVEQIMVGGVHVSVTRRKPAPSLEERLWKMYSEGKLTEIEQTIAAQQSKDVKWSPPKELIGLLVLLRADKKLLAAQEKGDYQLALDMYSKNPASFGCDRIGWAFFLAEAQVRAKQPQLALGTYQRLLKTCNDDAKMASLEHSQGIITSDKWQPMVLGQLGGSYKGDNRERLDKLYYKVLLQKIQEASDYKRYKEAHELGLKLQPMVYKYDDTLAAEIIGWSFFRGKYFENGLENFDYAFKKTHSPDALRGKVFCLGETGRYDELDETVEENKTMLTKEGVVKDVLPMMVGNALTKKNHIRALALLDELEAIRPLTMSELSMRGWAYYHYEKFDLAAKQFQDLYELKPDREVAKGWYYALTRGGNNTEIKRLVNELGDPFRSFVHQEESSQGMASNALGGVSTDVLASVEEPFVRYAFLTKLHNGQGAPTMFSRMVLRKHMLEGNTSEGNHEFNIKYERVTIDAGNGFIAIDPFLNPVPAGVAPGFTVGTMQTVPGQLNYAIPNIQTKYYGTEWSIGYGYHGDGTLYGELGQVLIPSAINDEWKWRVGYARAFDKDSWQFEFYRQPLRDTLISYMGTTDPYLGIQKWGQVQRKGISVAYTRSMSHKMTFGGNFATEMRTGHNVSANRNMAAYASLTRDISPRGFSYFAVGPYGRWQQAKMNQNHYTVGHGNYYSPQRLLDWGLASSFMTDTGKTWLMQADVSLGKQSVWEGSSPLFPTGLPPVAGIPTIYPSSANHEYHFSFQVAGVYALTERWRISAEYKNSRVKSTSKDPAKAALVPMQEHAFMFSATYHFDDRGEFLTRGDFPAFRLNPLY